MRAFWWFRENFVAGMARPGFNSFHFNDLNFDEAILLSWLGRFSSGSAEVESFQEHLLSYAPKTFSFYQLDSVTGPKTLEIFQTEKGLEQVLARLAERTRIFKNCLLEEGRIHFTLCDEKLEKDIQHLKKASIKKIITLTENHHWKDELGEHFETHHFGIEDLGAPELHQAERLAAVIQEAKSEDQAIAVHCLAGIGRTSTMIMAAHILLGESASELEKTLSRQNPAFKLTGSQEKFIQSLQAERP